MKRKAMQDLIQWKYNPDKMPLIIEGARASQYESALYWLNKVGLIYAIHKVETPNLPLSAYKKEAFKLYTLDVGLLSARVGLT
ncbi:MAG: DUF4143 domain-containing protein, partial [Holosporaceae bacterium]|nr:DUF4143 domain-containing protein [Holosporaceae bacterium]